MHIEDLGLMPDLVTAACIRPYGSEGLRRAYNGVYWSTTPIESNYASKY